MSLPVLPTRLFPCGKSGILPYTEVDYLESTGTQYIPIYTMTGNETSVRFVSEFWLATPSERLRNIVIPASGNGPRVLGLINPKPTNYSLRVSCDSEGSVTVASNIGTNIWHTLDATFESNGSITWAFNGQQGSGTRTFYAHVGTKLQIFGRNAQYYVGRLGKFRLHIDGVLVRDLIPVVLDTGNVACMYDKVSKTFLYNAGTGKFYTNLDPVPSA